MCCENCAELVQNNGGSYAEMIIAIIALIISIAAIMFEFFGAQRINRINLEASFYSKIYDEYLIEKLPAARNAIVYNDNCVSNTDVLESVLNDMRRASLFFKYKDVAFYDDLCSKLQCLEDELVRKSDKKLEHDDFCYFNAFINSSMDSIYDFILAKYTGRLFGCKRSKLKTK